mgnify:CR=1 FL=1
MVPHGSERDLFRREDEDDAAARQAQAREGLSRRAAGEDRRGRTEVQEEVGEEAEDGETGEEVAPKCVDLDLELREQTPVSRRSQRDYFRN